MMLTIAALLALSAQLPATAPACSSWGHQGKLLYADDFSGTMDQWVPEYTAKAAGKIGVDKGKLVVDVDAGATVWFRHELSGDLLITYKRKVLVKGGKNDRLSDFNHFWMASDPRTPTLFTRSGKFIEYDNLSLYYAGIGGNTNSTSRFRKYAGDGQKPLLAEVNDPAHLLQPNREYAVQIAVYQGCTRVLLDGEPYFTYRDPNPLTRGYFGFRTTESRHEIDDLKIYRLE